MSGKRVSIDADDLVKRYLAGDSVLALAARYGVQRRTIDLRLDKAGVRRRGASEAQRIRNARLTPEQRRAYATAAHDAVRGSTRSIETLSRRALTRQSAAKMGEYEATVHGWCRRRGLNMTPELAIGPYNADLAAAPVAVEVFGGNWHGSGRHAARFPKLARYLADQGWLLVIVWVTGAHGLREALADELVALYQQARRDPSLAGQYRVIWGCGEPAPTPADVDQLTYVPAGHTRCGAGA